MKTRQLTRAMIAALAALTVLTGHATRAPELKAETTTAAYAARS